MLSQVANSQSLRKDLVACSRATSWSNCGGQGIRLTFAESECLFHFSEICCPGIACSTISIRCKCISTSILRLHEASRWGWGLNSPGSGDPFGRKASGSAFLHHVLAWEAGFGQVIFCQPHAVGDNPHSPLDCQPLCPFRPTESQNGRGWKGPLWVI